MNRAALLGSFFGVCLLACGGSSASDVSGDGGDQGDASQGIGDSGGGDSSGGNGDGGGNNDGGGGNQDSGNPKDSGGTPGDGSVQCGNTSCNSPQVCCVTAGDGGASYSCAASCPDGGATITCDGPAQCGGGSPYCCGTVQIGAGTPPNCPYNSVVTDCRATCNTKLTFTCPATETIRLCKATADCANDANNPKCCSVPQSNGMTFCVSQLVSMAPGAQCL
jgi:hypothetical protein